MPIQIRCLGLPVAGPSHVQVECDPTVVLTLRDLIVRYLAPQFEGDLAPLLFDANGPREEYVILINGRNALGLGGLDTVLEDQAQVLIVPPVGGG